MYHVPLNWRRTKFSLEHPTTEPTGSTTSALPDKFSVFMPSARIVDMIGMRDWLHTVLQGRYALLGQYQMVTFQGIVVIFETATDLGLFLTQWMPVTLDA